MRSLQKHTKLILLALLMVNPILAQTTADGTIHGQIIDASGAPVPNVNVVAHSTTVGGTFKATSDSEGNYRRGCG